MGDVRDLELLIKSKVPIIVVESHEEERVLQILERISAQLRTPVFR